MKEFSAQHFADMSPDEFQAEAKRLDVDLYGKSRRQQIDAVYNAELRRRQTEAEQSSEQVSIEGEPGYSDMTVAELRTLAEERDVDLGQATRKADIIAVLVAADEGETIEE